MSYSIETIQPINGVYKGVVIDECEVKNRKLYKINLILGNDYTCVFGSINKLGNVEIGSCLLLKLCLVNFSNDFNKDKYPVLIIKSVLNSGLIDENEINNNIQEISNNKIKKINECIKLNNKYLFDIILDYDDYTKEDDVGKKVSNFLEIIKLATSFKARIENNDEENSIDVVYKKEGSRKDVLVFSIVFGETFTAFEYLDKVLFFENNDKYEIYALLPQIFKHFNIHLKKDIDLQWKFIEVFAPKLAMQEASIAKETYNNESEVIAKEHIKTNNLLKDKRILIIGRGALEHRQDLIYKIAGEYGFKQNNIIIENDNNKIISKGNDYIEKIKNNFFSGVIIGQTPHSSTGTKDANSLLDKMANVANKKYCYVHIAYIPLDDNSQRVKLKLSKARLKIGLEKIVENINKNN